MKLILKRKPTTPTYTEGDLYVDGQWFSYVLEDTVRPKGEKVYGKTAIPAGIYPVKATYSPKFKKVMTHIQNVPNFAGVRIHQGLRPEHSLGCPLTSRLRGASPGTLGAMKAGSLTDELTALVKAAGGAEIEIIDAA